MGIDVVMADEDDIEQAHVPPQGRPKPLAPRGPWWQVRPDELAARYGHNADRLMDDIDPGGLHDWQVALAFDALEICLSEDD